VSWPAPSNSFCPPRPARPSPTTGRHAPATLALAGLNTWSTGKTGSFVVGSDAFTLAQSGPDASGYYTVVSTGTVLGGTTLEANAVLTAKRFGLSPITFTADLDAFHRRGGPCRRSRPRTTAAAITVYAANTAHNANGPQSFPWAHGWRGPSAMAQAFFFFFFFFPPQHSRPIARAFLAFAAG